MDEARLIRDDEYAEMELRILVALHDAWPNPTTVRLGEVFRPAGRYTGPGDAPVVMKDLLAAGRVRGQLGAVGLTGGKLDPATHRRLDARDDSGTPRVVRAREVIAESCTPVVGHAREVRDQIWG